jgi:hypothetical protein
VYHPIAVRQWLGKNVTAAMNAYSTTGECLDASFSMQPMASRVADYVFSELLAV